MCSSSTVEAPQDKKMSATIRITPPFVLREVTLTVQGKCTSEAFDSFWHKQNFHRSEFVFRGSTVLKKKEEKKKKETEMLLHVDTFCEVLFCWAWV